MSRLARLGAPLAAAVVTAVALLGFAAAYVDGLWRKDAFDYAQIARELQRGEGFSSKQAIYALHLRFLKQHGLLEEPWPNLHRFPLPSAAIAAGFALVGVGDAAVVGYGIVFSAATAALLFAWGLRAAGPAVAVGATALFAASPGLLEIGVSGLAEPPAIFFFTLALYALWRGGPRAGAASAFAVGAALGLAGLARTNVLVAAPLFALALCWRTDPADGPALRPAGAAARRVALFAAGLALLQAPWWIRNALVAGSPTFSLHGYYLLPSEAAGLKWDATQPWVMDFVPPLEIARAHAAAIAAKWLRNMAALLADLPWLGGTLFVPLVALGALRRGQGGGLRPTALLVTASFALTALPVSLTDVYFDKYYFHFLPAWMLLAAAVAWTLAQRLGRRGAAAAAFALAIAAMAHPAGIPAAGRQVRHGGAVYSPEAMRFVRDHTGPDAVIFSDQSEAVAWLADRRSVRRHFARRPDGARVLAVELFHDEFLPIDGVYLSRAAVHAPNARDILRNTLASPRFAELFPRRHDFPDGAAFFYR